MAESVAEMFFLIALEEMGGRRRIDEDLLHFGVAGGVFADLALGRVISVDDAGLVRRARGAGPHDLGGAAGHVVDAVGRQERSSSVRHWIEEIGPTVFELVYQQLAEASVVRREHVAGLRRAEIYPATDLAAAAAPRLELARMFCDPRLFTLVAGVVAVLADVAGLRPTFHGERSSVVVREIMAELADQLPGDLRAITESVRTATAHRVALFR